MYTMCIHIILSVTYLQCFHTHGIEFVINRIMLFSPVVKEVGDVVRFGVEHTSKMSAKRVLSDCSVM